jgi:hypothetical protein
LPQKLGLQAEDVIEHAIDAPPLEPVVRNDPGPLEVAAQLGAERPVDTRLAAKLGILEQLETPVEGELPSPVSPQVHSVPSTSTRPAAVTRTLTVLRAGNAYGSVGWPSDANVAG